jgi:hypothetical protein
MGVVGDLSKYAQFQAAEAMRGAADNPGAGGMGAGLGMGMGIAMATQMAEAARAAGQPAAAPPPPPPTSETVWHIAEKGQTYGPYGHDELGRMAAEGRFGRNTFVWSAGMAGWTRAGEVAALAPVLAAVPPPPPPTD